MDYLKLPHMDSPVSVFDICQAHAQLESDYNVGGWVRERPSNQRRNESTSCQLSRIGYDDVYRWVDIYTEPDEDGDSDDEDVKDIYIQNVLKWGLPMEDSERAFIARRYSAKFLNTFPSWVKEQSCAT